MLWFWTKEYDRISKSEGWAIFNADGIMKIQKIDDTTEIEQSENLPRNSVRKFKSDHSALKFVVNKAKQGSEMHILALYLDGKENLSSKRFP